MVSRVVDTHAWILTLNGKVDEALPLLRAVIDNEPFPEARLHLATAFIKKGRGEEAEQQLLAAIDEIKHDPHPRDPDGDQKLLNRMDAALSKARSIRNEAVAR